MKKAYFLAWAAVAVRALFATAVSLDGTWSLSYRNQQDGGEWKTVAAQVPGDTFLALEQNGILPELQRGTNVFGLFQYEQCEWKYVRNFGAVRVDRGERVRLRFDGVDTRAEYFLNGENIGSSENMFVPVELDVTGKLKDENVLAVHIKSPLGRDLLGVLGRTRVGGTDVEGIRKAQHMFGWDIMPRLVTSGIWRSVWLETVPECSFGDVHWVCKRVDARRRNASLTVQCQILAPWRYLHKARLRLTLSRRGKVLWRDESIVRYFQTGTVNERPLEDVELWWPRDAGEPALYDATAELVGPEGELLATDRRKFAFRTVELERADWRSEEEPGTFRFIVNGEPIYMHGCDVSPMDAFHSRDRLHEARCLEMLKDLNCNMIRVWGGGVYESDGFYDFCDANGICVWQDFMMGNVEPEQNDRFAQAIYEEAKRQVIRLRRHPSIVMWCGNNEIDRSVGKNWGRLAPSPEGERISREVLPRVLRDFDPTRPYLPSSPWWTPEVVAGTAQLSQDHLWGPRNEYYKNDFWCRATPTFVSETGYHGCPNLESLRKMMTPEGLYPWPDKADKLAFNAEWNAKAVTSYPEQASWASGRNSLMTRQIENVFGSVPDELSDYVEQSQAVQAEALKYWVELSRSRKGRTWGLLWWNLRDGWPILSDGVVDWYYGKKLAYEYLKSVQQPQLVTCVDRHVGGNVRKPGRLVAVNDRRYAVSGNVSAVDCATKRELWSGKVEVPANGVAVLAEALPLAGRGMVRIEYVFEGVPRVNFCLYGEPPFDFGEYVNWRK